MSTTDEKVHDMKPGNAMSAARIAAVALAVGLAATVSGCGSSNARNYDISPIFPLSAGKCAKYGGVQKGTGPDATCMVTQDECKQAAADWRQVMRQSYVSDAIQFSCN